MELDKRILKKVSSKKDKNKVKKRGVSSGSKQTEENRLLIQSFFEESFSSMKVSEDQLELQRSVASDAARARMWRSLVQEARGKYKAIDAAEVSGNKAVVSRRGKSYLIEPEPHIKKGIFLLDIIMHNVPNIT
jgi:hypothetical protein